MESKLALKLRILNEIDNQPRGYAEILAKIAGYANGSNLKKVLKDEKKEFDKFNGLVELVRYLFNEDEQKLMEDYSKELDPNNKSARYMLEYLSCNRLFDSMKELIERMLVCKNKESIEWAKAYSIQYEWSLNYHNLDIVTVLTFLNEFKTNIIELKTLIIILRCNSYYKRKMYKMSYETSQQICLSIDNIKDEYIKAAYAVKYNEIMAYLSLRVRNEPEKAREHAEKVLELNIGKKFNAYAKFIKGYSYIFTSYDKAKGYLNESIKLYEEINYDQAIIDVKEELELLDIIWDRNIINVHLCNEYKYYCKVRNNMELNIENMNIDSENPFYYLIKGIKENNNNLLQQSVIRFIKRGDIFLANLPKFELLKRGFNEEVLNDLLSFYI